jgi:hypothetical protein
MDHLLVHRWGFTLIESKSVTTEVRINDRDEWSRLVAGCWKGMPSPVNQGKLQFQLLKLVLDAAAPELLGKIVGLQKRFGGLQYEVFAAISDDGIVDRPAPQAYPQVLKADSMCAAVLDLLKRYKGASGAVGLARGMLKPFSDSTLLSLPSTEVEATARYLLARHRPAAAAAGRPLHSSILVLPGQPTPAPGPVICADCPKVLSAGVVSFCRTQAERFKGKLYCMACQRHH